MCVLDEDKDGSVSAQSASSAFLRALGAALGGVVFLSAGMAQANAAERTLSMYHVHTKERITVTYWRDGRFIPSALRKLNWFLRDWRKNRPVRMDPRTIDLIWKLHADLGSKKPIHIISGHRSAATNAMLRRIGRKVARRSRHITGQAIDFRFPDVPTWKVRNLALAYGIGGVGYYGRNGFVHVDTGKVRHWPRMPAYKVASIVRQYRRYIGRGWKRGQGGGTIMIASRNKNHNFNRRAGNVLRLAKARKGGAVAQAVKSRKNTRPIPLPGVKPVLLAAAGGKALPARDAMKPAVTPQAMPTPRPRPYEVLVMAAARMEVTPASAPATITNFAKANSTRDPIGVVIASLPKETAGMVEVESTGVGPDGIARRYPRVIRSGKGDLAVALSNGVARGVPVVDDLARVRNASGKGDMMAVSRIDAVPEMLQGRTGAPVLGDVQQAGMYWPGLRVSAGPQRGVPQRVNRAEKGDLLTGALMPEGVRKAALREGALHAGRLQPISFR